MKKTIKNLFIVILKEIDDQGYINWKFLSLKPQGNFNNNKKIKSQFNI